MNDAYLCKCTYENGFQIDEEGGGHSELNQSLSKLNVNLHYLCRSSPSSFKQHIYQKWSKPSFMDQLGQFFEKVLFYKFIT